MTVHTFAILLLAGSASTGLWLAVRFARFTPRTFSGAAALLVSTSIFAWLLPSLLPIAYASLPFAAAAMVAAFPLLVAFFAAGALLLRYFVLVLASGTL